MSKPETTFIASVHRHLPILQELYRLKNNNPFNSGQADCWYSAVRDLWVEYKFIVVPKRPATLIVPGLSALQFDWCASRQREGRNVLVVVGSKAGGVVLRDATEWLSLPTHEFTRRMLTRPEIAQFLIKEVT